MNPLSTLRPSSDPGSTASPLYTLKPAAASEAVARDAGPNEYLRVSALIVGLMALETAADVRAYLNLASLVITSGDVTSALGYTPVKTVAGRTGDVLLSFTDVSGAAPVNSPAFTGVPLAPTAAPGTSTTQLATTAFVTSSPVFTGTPTAPTAAPGTNTTQLATTAFVSTACSVLAPLASPVFTGNPTAPTQAFTDVSTKLATTAFVYGVAISLPARRNFLWAGNFDTNPFQEFGTGVITPASNKYVADHWQIAYANTATIQSQREANAPTVAQCGMTVSNCLRIAATVADAAVAAGDYAAVTTFIEGYDYALIAGSSFTLSFWHAHGSTGTYCIAFRNSGVDRSYIAEYTQTAANTWEYATVTVPASPSAGTWNYTTGIGLSIGFAMMCGSTFQTPAGSWTVGNFLGSSNQFNIIGTTNAFRLALVQLERGSYATPYDAMPMEQVKSIARRYYETSYNLGVAVPTNSALGFVTAPSTAAVAVSGVLAQVRYVVEKRIVPTVAVYSFTSSTASVVSTGSGTDLAAASGTPGNKTVFAFDVVNQSAGSISPAANSFVFHYAADARF